MAKQRNDNRPEIWVEGRQNPPFEPRAFALASVQFARKDLAGVLTRIGSSVQEIGEGLEAGRWRLPPERLGRSGRFLPSAESTGAAVNFAAEVLQKAGSAVAIEEEAIEPLPLSLPDRVPRSSLPSKAQTPVRKLRPVSLAPAKTMAVETASRAEPIPEPSPATCTNSSPEAEPSPDAELAAIRLLIANSEPDHISNPAPRPQLQLRVIAPEPPAARLADRLVKEAEELGNETHSDPTKSTSPASKLASGALTRLKSLPIKRDWIIKAFAYPLGYALLVAAVPIGMLRALLAHLNGQDLRKMVED